MPDKQAKKRLQVKADHSIHNTWPRVCGHLIFTALSGSSPNFYHNPESTELARIPLYAVALRLPFTGTKEPRPNLVQHHRAPGHTEKCVRFATLFPGAFGICLQLSLYSLVSQRPIFFIIRRPHFPWSLVVWKSLCIVYVCASMFTCCHVSVTIILGWGFCLV